MTSSEPTMNGDAYPDDLCEEQTKIIYIQIRNCFEENSKHNIQSGVTKSVAITKDFSCKALRKLLLYTFKIDDETVALKLRNLRGSIIPICSKITENMPSRPYTLEVCERYQNVKPLRRTASLTTYEEVLKRKVQSIATRLKKLEDFVPDLPEKQKEKINKEITDINERMSVLDRKLGEADETQWQGMFKRNPLW